MVRREEGLISLAKGCKATSLIGRAAQGTLTGTAQGETVSNAFNGREGLLSCVSELLLETVCEMGYSGGPSRENKQTIHADAG